MQSDQFFSRILGLSLFVNVALVAWFCLSHGTPGIPNNGASDSLPVRNSGEAQQWGVTTGVQSMGFALPEFRWPGLDGTNWLEYAEQLRASGMPREGVRDALLPEINSEFRRAILPYAAIAFARRWSGIPQENRDEHRKLFDRLSSEREQLLRALLGEEWLDYRAERYKPWEFSVRQEEYSGLEDSARERLHLLKKQRVAEREMFKKKGLSGADLDSAMEPFVQAQEDEISTFVSPEIAAELRTKR